MLGRRLLRVVPRLSTSRYVASVSETATKKTSGNESSFSRYAGMAVFGAVAATTAYLGTWQVERYYWKVDLIKERTKELSESVIELPKNATARDDTDDIEYRQLRVDGHFKPGSTFYLCKIDDSDPRSAPADPNDSVARVKSGGYIYSLLERENGTPVIVNQGWLPRELLDAHMARDKKEEDVNVSFVGVLRHEEVRNRFTPDNDPENRHFFYVDQRELADAMGVRSTDLPVMVDALAVDGASAEVTLDKPMQTSLASYLEFYMTPEKHVGYAATWFGISLAAAIMGMLRFKKGAARAPRAKFDYR